MERTKESKPEFGRVRTQGKGQAKAWLWNEDRIRQVYEIALLGATEAEIAKIMGISKSTLTDWKQTKVGFLDALEDGKQKADAKVAKALFQRAIGYNAPDVHISNYKGEITITPISKHYPPDVKAQIFWLKNRQRDKWTDPNYTEINSNLNISHTTVDLKKYTDEELKVMEKVGMMQLLSSNPSKN